MFSRPSFITVGLDGVPTGQVNTPSVFNSAIRPDIVQSVHDCLLTKKRQSYAVSNRAGQKTAAESWGTGRAVARIPRVPGGGTRRSGQGAFGNMCRGGHMYGATKIWRKWHRKVNLNIRRYAMCSALAASALSPLVMARGHRIEKTSEIPIVVDDTLECVSATTKALAIIIALGAGADIKRSTSTSRLRAGRGKMRNRRYVIRKGPMIVYASDYGISRSFRNIPGLDVAKVESINLLKLAPGGKVGRLLIWTKSALIALNRLFGSHETNLSHVKQGFVIPRPLMTNSNLNRLINSDEVQSVVNMPKKDHKKKKAETKKNPLRNKAAMLKMNPQAFSRKIHRYKLKSQTHKTSIAFYKSLSIERSA